MSKFWEKVRTSWVNSFIFSCFLVLILWGIFSIFSLFFTSFSKDNDQNIETKLVNLNLDEEIQKRLGSIELVSENYSSWAKRNDLDESNQDIIQDPDSDNLANYLEFIYGTNPLKKDSDKDNYSDKVEIDYGYDPNNLTDASARPRVEVSIPKINLLTSMNWAKSEKQADMFQEIKNETGRYLGTAAPGQNGNSVIFGRSNVFGNLDKLESKDEIIITTFQQNGKIIAYRYIVDEAYKTSLDDERIFEKTDSAILTLSTPWPINANFYRFIVKAELAK